MDPEGRVRPDDARAERTRRIRRHALVLLVVTAITLVIPTTALLWRVTAIRGWAASRLVAEMSAALDADVGVDSIDLRPGLPPQVILNGLTITHQGRVLARVGRVLAEPRLGPLVQGRLDLASLVLERAQFDINLDDVGESSTGRPRQGAALPRIDALQLRDSRLSFRHAASGFELDVPRLSASSPGLLRDGHVFLSLEGEGARVAVGAKALQPVDFTGRIGLDDRGLRISDVRVRAPGLSAWMDASVDLEGARGGKAAAREPSLRATVELEGVTGELVALGLLPPSVPGGTITWDGEVLGTPRGWRANGRVQSDALELRQDLRPTPLLRGVRGKLSLSAAAVELTEFHAGLGRGELDAELRATRGKDGWLLAGSARVEALPLREIPLPRELHAHRPDLDGSIGIDVEGVVPLFGPSDARLSWSFGLSPGERGDGGLSIAGEGHGRWRDGRAEIAALDLSIPGAGLAVAGTLGLDGSLDASGSVEVPRLRDALSALRPHVEGLRGMPEDLDGALVLTGAITGSLDAPSISAHLEGADLAVGSWPLGQLDGDFAWQDGLTASARVEGEALTLSLDEISGGAGDQPLTGRWEILGANAGLLAQLAEFPEASGSLAGSGSFTSGGDGSEGFAVAGALEGHDLSVAGQPLDHLSVEGRASARSLEVSRFELLRGDAHARGSGSLPWSEGGASGRGLAAGEARLEWSDWPIEFPLAGAPLTMHLSGSAAIRGSVARPVVGGPIPWRGGDVRWRGFGPFELEGDLELLDEAVTLKLSHPASGASVEARIGRGDDRSLRALGTLPQLRVPLPLPLPRGDGDGDGDGSRPLSVQLDDMDLIVDGTLDDLPNVRIEATASNFAVLSDSQEPQGTAALRLAGSASKLVLESVKLSLFGQEFAVGGSASLVDPVSWEVDAEGDVPLRAFEPFVPGARLGGMATIVLRASGQQDAHSISGSAVVAEGYINHPALPQSVRAIDARLGLERGLLRLESMECVVGGGRVTGSGQGRLDSWALREFDAELHGESVALRLGEHLRATADFGLTLESRGEDALLQGDVRLLRARYSEPAALGAGGSRLARLRPPGRLDSLLLDLHVRAPDQFVLDNDLLKAEFEADLDILGSASHPVVLGSLDLVRQGQLFYKRTIFALSDASFQLTRAFPSDPEIDAHATARVGLHDIEMGLSGRASDPSIELSSYPELPRESLVAMLATSGMLGTSTDRGSGAALPAPFSLPGTGSDSSLSAAGVDPIRLDPVFVEGSALPSSHLTLGRQLTPKLFAGYSMSLRGDQGGTMELRYRVKPRLELRLAYEEGGSNVGEMRWTRSWRSGKARAAETALRGDEDAPKVAVVSLVGVLDHAEHASVLDALALNSGDRATRSALMRAAGAGTEFLVAHDHPLARVECDTDGEPNDAEVDVICRADIGPRVALIIEGVDPAASKAAREAVLEAWAELAFNDELVPAATIAAQDALLALGHARVTARGVADEVEGGLEVRVSLTPGDVLRVSEVKLSGVDSLDEKSLRRELNSTHRRGWKRPKLTPTLAEVDAATLLGAYQAEGFVDAKVAPPIVSYPTDEPLAALEFRVDEGERQHLVGVLFSGNSAISREDLEEMLGLGVGDVARPDELDAFAQAVSEALDAKGHPDAALSWRLRRASDGVVLECVIAEGPSVIVGDVRIQGLVRTRESVVRREIRLQPGEVFRRSSLARVRQRLAGLGQFQTIVVRAEPRPDDIGVRDVLVRVTEKPELDVSLGFGVDDSRPRGSFSIGRRNIAGTGASLGLQLSVAGADRLARGLLGLQRVGGTRNDLLMVAGFERDDHPDYTSDVTFLGVQLARPLAPHLTLLPRMRWEDVKLPRLDVPAEEARLSEGVIAGPGVALLWDTRDDPLWPRKGSVASLDVSLSTATFGADHSFTKAFVQYSIARSFGRRGMIAAGSIRAGAGWSFDESERLPLSERFYAGGVGSVRGWALDRLGPRDPDTGGLVSGGGDAVLVMNTELRVPITRRTWFIGFIDAGNVYARPSELVSPSVELTFGPGIAFSTPVGPLRFYYGQKLVDPPGEPSGEFHFTFGGTF